MRRTQRKTKPTYRDVLMRPTLSVDYNYARESIGALQRNPPTSSDHIYAQGDRLERDNATLDGPSTSGMRRTQRKTKPTYRDVLMRPTLSSDHNYARESVGALQRNPPTSSDHNYAQRDVSRNRDDASERDAANEQSPKQKAHDAKGYSLERML